jgi:hypothetical protein
MIVSDGIQSTDRITVRRRTETGTHVLIANQPLTDFFAISAHESGVDTRSGAALTELVDSMARDKVITVGRANEFAYRVGGQSRQYGFINLGSLYLGKDSELDIAINFGSNSLAGRVLRGYLVSARKSPDVMLQYIESRDMEANHVNTESLFMLRRNYEPFFQTSYALNGADVVVSESVTTAVDVQISDGEFSYLADIVGMQAQTAIFGQAEIVAPQYAYKLYQTPDSLPHDIYVRISGEDQDKVRLVTRVVKYDQRLTSRNTIAELDELANKIAKLERENGDQAKAMRHAGVIGRSEDLKLAAEAARATAVTDAALGS